MKKGDFVKLDYIGRIKETGEIFDTTREDVAKKEGIHNPKVKYGPASVVIGGDKIVKGIDEILLKMKIGEKKRIDLPPEKAFGRRNPKLIKLIPLSEFKKQNITPIPGMPISMNNLRGRILSVNSGRVRIDFNNPLAGKNVVYDLELREEIKKTDEKIKGLCEYYGVNCKNISLKEDNSEVEITFDGKVDEKKKEMIKKDIKQFLKIEKIKFSEVFGDKK